MKNVLLVIVAFVLGFGAVLGYHAIRTKLTVPTAVQTASQSTPEPTLALVPPAQAVSGVLTVTIGHAKKFSRNETEYKEASTGAQILLGESIATSANSSATASVGGIVNVSLGPTAELVFANLFPVNFVLQQKNGKIEYRVTTPISVRALHTLISMNPGVVTVNIIDTDMSIAVTTGSVKFAIVDNDNNTRVYTLGAGQRANIDDVAREVFLINAK